MSESTFTNTPVAAAPVEIEDDWEEWDGVSPFWVHCAAGSLAGVVEHTAVYPLDTVRTHIQVACAACAQMGSGGSSSSLATPSSSGSDALVRGATSLSSHQPRVPMGMWQTIRHLVNEPVYATTNNTAATSMPAAARDLAPTTGSSPAVAIQGYIRLWRGVQTMLIGCVPAHALYFSAYELVKGATRDRQTGQVTAWGSSLAGAASVTCHDLIMTPLDVIKQRMQLGQYNTVGSAFSSIYTKEGISGLYRSLPVTLGSNLPYGMIMISTHEIMKQVLSRTGDGDHPTTVTVLISSSMAGFMASAATTPLDRIKTALQTQDVVPLCYKREMKRKRCRMAKHATIADAARWIYQHEGMAGFTRGMAPRILSHTPAAAISWTTYETAKKYLMPLYAHE